MGTRLSEKMWNPDGTVLQRVHISGAKSPPSADNVLRNFNPPIPKTSGVVAGEFAHVYVVFKKFPELADYADDLLEKANICWNWMKKNSANFEYDEMSLQIKIAQSFAFLNDTKSTLHVKIIFLQIHPAVRILGGYKKSIL